MEKLILILLLGSSLCCKGQLISVEDLKQYAIECYNDSSFVKIMVKPDGWCNTAGEGGMITSLWCPAIYENKWLHRTESFKGFLDFIKLKYPK